MTTKKTKPTTSKTNKKESKRDDVRSSTAPPESAGSAAQPDKTGKSAPPTTNGKAGSAHQKTGETPSSSKNPFNRQPNRAEERVHVLGSLDRALDDVDRLLAKGTTDILLDFSGCPFITVDGLEWLEELLMRAASMQSNVRFVNIYPSVYKTFKVSRIDSILKACGAPGPASGPVC